MEKMEFATALPDKVSRLSAFLSLRSIFFSAANRSLGSSTRVGLISIVNELMGGDWPESGATPRPKQIKLISFLL